MSYYRWEGEDLVLELRLQPRASRDAFDAPLGGRLKIRLTAPPVDGRANARLIAFLSKQFRVAKSQVLIEAGETSRDKRVRVRGPRLLPAGIKRP